MTESPTRRRDAAATRAALLAAARDLFGANGYNRTTLRDVGEAAGVDASLIARYFGNKVALYVAVLNADRESMDAGNLETVEGIARRVVSRVDRHGTGPLMHAMVDSEADPEIRQVAADHLRGKLVDPIARQAAAANLPHPELRAELIVALLTGVAHLRTTGDLPRLAAASADDLVTAIDDLFMGNVTTPVAMEP